MNQTYLFAEAARGGTAVGLWEHFAKHQPLPADEVLFQTASGPHALRLWLAGPIQEEPQPMPAESHEKIAARIIEALVENKTGLTAREIANHANTERAYSDTALQGLIRDGRVTYTLQERPTPNGYHAFTVYTLVQAQ